MSLRSATKMKRVLNSVNKSTKYLARSSSQWAPDKTIKTPFSKIDIPNTTLYDYVWENLEKWPEKTLSVSIFIKF